jgi:DNA-directed RNA polymerase specialized sigma24 family protein
MLAKKVLRNGIGLNSRIREQMVIYHDWKSMAMEIDEDEVHEIVESAWNDLIDSIRMKRNLEEIIMANNNADQREILRLRYFYAATWAAIADELNDTVDWVKEQHSKALKKIHVEVTDFCEDCD